MKLLLVVCLVSVSACYGEVPITRYYHETIGIPKAHMIRQIEEGRDFDGARIVGGSPSPLGANPHLGGLVITLATGQQSVCGSSLVSDRRLVTAAHCWTDGRNQAASFTVVLGSERLYSGGLRLRTNNVRAHERYDTRTLNNDVAIIAINPIQFTDTIRPVALATGNSDYVGVWATAAGYGKTNDWGGVSQTQNQVRLQVITNAECARTFGSGVVVASTLCVSGRAASTCGGDSGGPLVDPRGTLIGITSFGSSLGCQRGYPAGFARVTSFAGWFQARL